MKSDVITLGSIEMYGLVTVWTSMDDGPYWVIILKYGSHDMRHTGFRRLTMVNRTPGFWGVTKNEKEVVEILRKHKEAIAWSVEDLKGINPSICMHKILMEENARNSIKRERRLNPVMKEVVKKEVLNG